MTRRAAVEAMHVCERCASPLVHPLDWEERGVEGWHVLLRCPNCELLRAGVFTQQSIEAFDLELDQGTLRLVSELSQLTQTNMLEYVDRFVAALANDAIEPIDF